MKKLFTIFLATLIAAVSCQQVEPLVESEKAVGPEFSAQIEEFGRDTKTALAYGNSVVWSAGDQLAIFQGESLADKYQVKSDRVGTTSGTFEIVANGAGTPTATFPTNIAVYPYEENLNCTPNTENGAIVSYQITGVTVPSVQTYVPDSFPDDAFLMVAMTDGLDNHTLNFKNLCGALKLQLKGTMKVKSIVLQGHDGEKLSGGATISVYPDGTLPAISMSEDASATVKLDCGEGVQLNAEESKDFIVSIPPSDFAKGFTAIISGVDGSVAKIETMKTNGVNRSYVHTMPATGVDCTQYFGLEAPSIHISFDDVTACLSNLSSNVYPTLYDEPFFGWLKQLNTTYGARFSLYVYNLATLASVPETYRQEFFDSRHWLKFGLHAKTSGYNYASGTYDGAQSDWNTLVENVVRITGSYQSLDRIPRLHNFAGNLESVLGMRDANCGALGFLGADDSRVSYHLTDEQNQRLISQSFYNDSENDLIIFRTNYRGERLASAEGMYDKMEAFYTNPAYADCFSPFVWFTHEPYVYKKSALTEYAKNVEDVCRFAYDHDIPFVYPQNRIDLEAEMYGYQYESLTDGVLSPKNRYRKTPMYTLSGGQDGTIYNGFSLQGNGGGTVTVRNVETGVTMGTMKWDKVDLLKPHDNSVSHNVSKATDVQLTPSWTLNKTYTSEAGALSSGTRAVTPKFPLAFYRNIRINVSSCKYIVSCYDKDGAYLGQINPSLDGLVIGTGQWIAAGTEITEDMILSVDPAIDNIALVAFSNENPEYSITYSGDILHVYSNVYNSYASAEDKHIGECCVYEVGGAGKIWSNSLAQVIRIGFIGNLDYWPAATEARPYGNFVVDKENGWLYAFVMYSSKKLTYWYKFDLPEISEGVWNESYQCPVITLMAEDILDSWTTPLQNYVQGACVHNGLIWSTEGFTATSGTNVARMRVIDPARKTQIAVFNFYSDADPVEPEFIDFCNGKCYYGSVRQMYLLELL